MIIPSRLKKGDKIGIVSPSGPILPATRDKLDSGIRFFESLGFEIQLSKNALKVKGCCSAGTPQECAEDINSMFADKEIKGIFCSQGGNVANSVLPFIEWDTINFIFLGKERKRNHF